MFIYLCDFNAPNIHDETVNIEFVKNKLNPQLPDPENEPDLFEHARNIRKMNVTFHSSTFLLIKQLLQKHLRLEKILTRKMKLSGEERLC